MPLIQQILLAIRTLTEDEPPPPRRKNRHGQSNRQRRNSKRQQAANLVLTFRDLFASGGLNYLVDDDHVHRRNRNDRHCHSQQRKNSKNTPDHSGSEFEPTKQCLVDLTDGGKCVSGDSSSIDLISSDNTVAILNERGRYGHSQQRSNSKNIPNPSGSALESTEQCLVDLTDECKCVSGASSVEPENAVAILLEERIISTELPLPICINANPAPEMRELEVFGRSRRRRKPVTVPLSSDDENKTVAALRKVLKWSPTKQSLATFTVSLPKEEEHKAVAVVQNAVNRVKEEQQKKKKRKFKLFKLTFC